MMLILNYSFKNFYSFKDEAFIDLTTTKSKRNSYTHSACNKNINRVSAFFGANGAGKTNALKALAFIDWFTTRSFSANETEDSLPITYHLNHIDEPFKFSMEFCHYDEQYKYILESQHKEVTKESLLKKSNETQKYISLFNRYKKNGSYVLTNHNLALPEHFENLERSNCSLISYFISTEASEKKVLKKNYRYKQAAIAFSAFMNINTNIFSGGKKESTDADLFKLSKELSDNPEKLTAFEAFVKALDLGIDSLTLKEINIINENKKQETAYVIFAKHCCSDGSEFELPIFEESSGTKKILSSLRNLMPALTEGSVAVIDELDSDLHPYMLPFILDVFSNPELSSDPGQLLFSAHTSEAMHELNKSQIFLVEKDDQLSEIYRADEIEGLRTQDNLYKKYITGALGGVPDLDASEIDQEKFQKARNTEAEA